MSVDLAASAIVDGDSQLAVILDLSPKGARLMTREQLPLGQALLVCNSEFTRRAVVVWTVQNRCGVNFLEPFDSVTFEALLLKARP